MIDNESDYDWLIRTNKNRARRALARASFYGTTGASASGFATDASTTSWVAAVVANSGTVSVGRQTTVNNLIAGLRADGVWTKLDRLWILAAENSQSALTDMSALTLATVSGAPAFVTDRGYTGQDLASPTAFINSNFNPSTQGVQYTQNAAHHSCWSNTNVGSTNGGCAMGANSLPQDSQFFLTFSDNNVYGRINDNPASSGQGIPGTRQGYWTANRSGASASQLYQNGALFSSPNATSGALINLGINLLAGNTGGAVSAGNPNQFSMFSFGGNLTAGDVTNFYNRLRTYMTAVGVP